jgi:hypothetical protein
MLLVQNTFEQGGLPAPRKPVRIVTGTIDGGV